MAFSGRRGRLWLGAGVVAALLLVVVVAASLGAAAARRRRRRAAMLEDGFQHNYAVTWAADHVKVSDGGRLVQLLLDPSSGAAFASRRSYLFGQLALQIELPRISRESTGAIVSYYMSSLTDDRDEFSFRFFAGSVLQTDVVLNGVGGREQRFLLWFDPAADFHTYSVLWNQHNIVFLVDGITLRVYKNVAGLPYALSRPVGVYSSIWAANSSVQWDEGPLQASYRSPGVQDACDYRAGCSGKSRNQWWQAASWPWDANQQLNLTLLRQHYLLYDYCSSSSSTSSPECTS